MVRMSFTIPAPSTMLVSNVLGVAGLAAVLTAVGFLLDWRWALLGAGLALLGIAYVGALHAAAAQRAEGLEENVSPHPVLAAAEAAGSRPSARPGATVRSLKAA